MEKLTKDDIDRVNGGHNNCTRSEHCIGDQRCGAGELLCWISKTDYYCCRLNYWLYPDTFGVIPD